MNKAVVIKGRFRLIRRLGIGGMGEVWLATTEGPSGFEKHVAVKLLHGHLADQEEFVIMFMDEARLAGRLTHPNIVQTLELGEEDGRHYIVMEYVAGPSLKDVMRRLHLAGRRMPLPVTLHVIERLLSALDYAHNVRRIDGKRLEIVHRDISPDNVLISRDALTVKLADFGLARAIDQLHSTATQEIKGKIHRMAPEQLEAKPVDARADVYATGLLLYELLTGRSPFQKFALAELRDMNLRRLPLVSSQVAEIPNGLDEIVQRSMEPDVERRFMSAGEMLQEMQPLISRAYDAERQLDLVLTETRPTADMGRTPPVAQPAHVAVPVPAPTQRSHTPPRIPPGYTANKVAPPAAQPSHHPPPTPVQAMAQAHLAAQTPPSVGPVTSPGHLRPSSKGASSSQGQGQGQTHTQTSSESPGNEHGHEHAHAPPPVPTQKRGHEPAVASPGLTMPSGKANVTRENGAKENGANDHGHAPTPAAQVAITPTRLAASAGPDLRHLADKPALHENSDAHAGPDKLSGDAGARTGLTDSFTVPSEPIHSRGVDNTNLVSTGRRRKKKRPPSYLGNGLDHLPHEHESSLSAPRVHKNRVPLIALMLGLGGAAAFAILSMQGEERVVEQRAAVLGSGPRAAAQTWEPPLAERKLDDRTGDQGDTAASQPPVGAGQPAPEQGKMAPSDPGAPGDPAQAQAPLGRTPEPGEVAFATTPPLEEIPTAPPVKRTKGTRRGTVAAGSLQVDEELLGEQGDKAFLTVHSSGNAQVSFDGKIIGHAPLKLQPVASGKHQVRIDCVVGDQVTPGQTKHVDIPPSAEVVVQHRCIAGPAKK